MSEFRIRPLTESDLTEIVEAAGGRVAHPDAHSRKLRGADYVLGDALIELKALDEDGLKKEARQIKLAKLFLGDRQGPPVVVLDRARLSVDDQRTYDQLMAAPLKTPITSARAQLNQSRSEFPEATASILWVINNSFTALDHDELVRLVAHRVRSDTTSIDGVVVGGCYFYGDGMDHFFIWPLTYVPISLNAFAGFDKLKSAWDDFAERFTTEAMLGDLGPVLKKGPVIDSQFDVGGITFVKPAAPLGMPSDFYPNGRPPRDSTGLTACPPVAISFPALSQPQWRLFKEALPTLRSFRIAMANGFLSWRRLGMRQSQSSHW